jgi:hypothetical protein
MATTTTFLTLKQDMERYLERGGGASDPRVTEQIPRLINLAERRMARELKVQGFISPVVSNLLPGQSVYAKPDRWRDTVSMTVGLGAGHTKRTPLFARSYEYLRAYWPDESERGIPQFYADYDYTHWLILPTPDAGYPLEVMQYTLPVLLDDTTQSNWLTDYAPQALLYASLLEATPFLKNDERIAVWQGLYDRAIASLNSEDLDKILDRAAQRKEA